MSMAGRFTALLLATLGVVLIGFSAALFFAVRYHLYRQIDDRLVSALAVLAAAAEIHPDSVEWEPQERFMPLGQDANPEQLRWMVNDGRGRSVDHSRNLDVAELTKAWTTGPGSSGLPTILEDRIGRVWRVSQRRILPSAAPQSGSRVASNRREGINAAAGGAAGYDLPADRYPELILMTCTQIAPTEATLAKLGWTLTGLVAGAWAFCAVLCRRLAKRALAPLSRMVESSAGLDAADGGWCLELPGTGDELDELGRAFNELLARLHLAFERQRRFGGDVSHQLRTPLTVLIGQVEVALRQKRSEEEYQRALKSALGRARHLSQIVEALLFLVRAEGEAELPECETFDVNRWLARHVADRPAAGRSSEINLRTGEGDGLWVRSHPPLLGQLLDNLLDNSEKYGRAGTPIIVGTSREGEMAVMSVEDSGPGIPAGDIPRVFEPFYRAEQSRRRGISGAGLGLAVVRRIAGALGGSVEVRSEEGKGCRFEIRLPAASPPSTRLNPTQANSEDENGP